MEKRTASRVLVDSQVRIRAAGSSGAGIACYLSDASTGGLRLLCEEAIDSDWTWIEILKASGEALDEPLEVRVVRTADDPTGFQEVGCAYE